MERDGLWKGRGKQVHKKGMNIFLQGSTYATEQEGIVVASPLQGFSTAILSESDEMGRRSREGLMLWDKNGRNYGWDTGFRKHRSLRAHALLANTEGVKMGKEDPR